jgi:hypothetical protein
LMPIQATIDVELYQTRLSEHFGTDSVDRARYPSSL